MIWTDHIMGYSRMLPDLSGRLDKAQNHHHSHHPFDALIRFALRVEREDIKTIICTVCDSQMFPDVS